MHKVLITMRNGKPTITVKGAKGKTCEKITADLERDLGSVTKKTTTAEYHEKTQDHTATH